MKVFYNGLNLYQQFPTPNLHEGGFIDYHSDLREIEVTYSFSVSLVADCLIYTNGGKNIEIFQSEIADFSCSENKILVLKQNGNLYKVLIDDLVPTQVSFTEEKIVKISCGSKLNVALTDKGNVYNIPCKLDFKCNFEISQIETGREHCLILDKNGNIYSFGCGSRGQLGHDSLEDETDPKLIDALAGVKIVKISSGGWHSSALSKDGDLYTWGWNGNNQLGVENFSVVPLPKIVDFPQDLNVRMLACGNRHTIALLENGELWGCGWNKYKQLKGDAVENVKKMTSLGDFSDRNVVGLECGPWNSIVLCNV